MKKVAKLLALAAAVAFAACTDRSYQDEQLVETAAQGSETTVDQNTTEAYACKAMQAFFPDHSTALPGELTKLYSAGKALSRSTADGDGPRYTVVNFPNEGGYVIFAGEGKSENDMVAVVPKGSLDPTQEIENPGLRMYLSSIPLPTDPRPGLEFVDEFKEVDDTTKKEIVNPRLSSDLKPKGFFSQYLSSKECHSYILAMILLMSYYEYPPTLSRQTGNFSRAESTFTPSWGEIRTLKDVDDFTLRPPVGMVFNFPPDVNADVPVVINKEYHLRTNEDLPAQGNGAVSESDAQKVLSILMDGFNLSGFKPYALGNKTFDYQTLEGGIRNGVVLMYGENVKSNNDRFFFVADGFKHYSICRYYYTKKFNEAIWKEYDKKNFTEIWYHLKWNFGEKYDGYYRLDFEYNTMSDKQIGSYKFNILTRK